MHMSSKTSPLVSATSSPNATSFAWRGLVSIVFGIVALAWPGVTLEILTLLFGAYAMADGVLALLVAARRGPHPHRWLLVVDGLLGLGVGVLTFVWPGITLLVLVVMIGIRFTLMGAMQIGASLRLRHLIPMPVLYAVGGIASVLVGVLAFIMPGLTAFALVLVLGVYALVFGGALVALSVLAWRVHHHHTLPPAHAR